MIINNSSPNVKNLAQQRKKNEEIEDNKETQNYQKVNILFDIDDQYDEPSSLEK